MWKGSSSNKLMACLCNKCLPSWCGWVCPLVIISAAEKEKDTAIGYADGSFNTQQRKQASSASTVKLNNRTEVQQIASFGGFFNGPAASELMGVFILIHLCLLHCDDGNCLLVTDSMHVLEWVWWNVNPGDDGKKNMPLILLCRSSLKLLCSRVYVRFLWAPRAFNKADRLANAERVRWLKGDKSNDITSTFYQYRTHTSHILHPLCMAMQEVSDKSWRDDRYG